MEYIRIPHVKGKVSRIIFGTAMKPFNEGKSDDALLDAVLAMGVTVLDTARVYGGAEEALGGWLERTGCRDRVVILSKCGHFDLETGRRRVCPEAMRADLQTSLEALHTGPRWRRFTRISSTSISFTGIILKCRSVRWSRLSMKCMRRVGSAPSEDRIGLMRELRRQMNTRMRII